MLSGWHVFQVLQWLMLAAAQSSFYNNATIFAVFQTPFQFRLAAAVTTCKKLQISVSDTYRSSRFLIVNLKVGHGFNDGHYGLDCVAVDNSSVLLTLIFWVSILMDNPENRDQRERGDVQEEKRLVCHFRYNHNVTMKHNNDFIIYDYTLHTMV